MVSLFSVAAMFDIYDNGAGPEPQDTTPTNSKIGLMDLPIEILAMICTELALDAMPPDAERLMIPKETKQGTAKNMIRKRPTTGWKGQGYRPLPSHALRDPFGPPTSPSEPIALTFRYSDKYWFASWYLVEWDSPWKEIWWKVSGIANSNALMRTVFWHQFDLLLAKAFAESSPSRDPPWISTAYHVRRGDTHRPLAVSWKVDLLPRFILVEHRLGKIAAYEKFRHHKFCGSRHGMNRWWEALCAMANTMGATLVWPEEEMRVVPASPMWSPLEKVYRAIWP